VHRKKSMKQNFPQVQKKTIHASSILCFFCGVEGRKEGEEGDQVSQMFFFYNFFLVIKPRK